MKNLLSQTVPAWFELSLKSPDTIIVRIHERAFEKLKSIDWPNTPIVGYVTKEASLKAFESPTDDGYFGFGQTLRVASPSGDSRWFSVECKLPILYSGKWVDDSLSKVWEIRYSLAILFSGLSMFETETDSTDAQLMADFDLRVESGPHGGSLSVLLTVPACVWLSKRPDHSHIIPVEDAMRSASMHMWKGVKRTERFMALCRKPKWINLDVPGDACGLDPSDYNHAALDRGYKLFPHNVDSSLQQLTFLAGLAKLHDEMRAR
jgi:hypothetical protein